MEPEPKPKYEPPVIEKYMAYFVVPPAKIPTMVWALKKEADKLMADKRSEKMQDADEC